MYAKLKRGRYFCVWSFLILQIMLRSVRCFLSPTDYVRPTAYLKGLNSQWNAPVQPKIQHTFQMKLFMSSKALEDEVDPGEVAGLRIVKYPHPALRAENKIITEFDDDLKKLSKDMFKLMYAAEGVGLAAPQVAKNVRLMVFNPEADPKKWLMESTLVNPEIVDTSEGKDMEIEGCLSFPGMNGSVQRSKWIKVKYQDLKGKTKKKKFAGWEARIFQHEYDHLDGTVYIDRLSEEDRAQVQPRLDELVEEYGPDGAL